MSANSAACAMSQGPIARRLVSAALSPIEYLTETLAH
jgi:hypothetical protein